MHKIMRKVECCMCQRQTLHPNCKRVFGDNTVMQHSGCTHSVTNERSSGGGGGGLTRPCCREVSSTRPITSSTKACTVSDGTPCANLSCALKRSASLTVVWGECTSFCSTYPLTRAKLVCSLGWPVMRISPSIRPPATTQCDQSDWLAKHVAFSFLFFFFKAATGQGGVRT